MNKMQMRYFEREDILYLEIGEGSERRSLELSPNVTVELDERDEVIAVEILNASAYLRNIVAESIQAKNLRLPETQLV